MTRSTWVRNIGLQPGKQRGVFSIPRGATVGVMVTGEVAGGGDGYQKLKLKFQTKNIPFTHIFSSGLIPQKDTPVTPTSDGRYVR